MRRLYYLPFLLAAIILTSYFFNQCKQRPVTIGATEAEVKIEKKQHDSIRERIVYREVIRTKTVTRYREVRRDSLIPCEEKLIICDTIIVQDSALIAEYKALASVDISIICNQGNVIADRNKEISGLKKQVRRQKIQKWVLAAVLAAREGMSLAR